MKIVRLLFLAGLCPAFNSTARAASVELEAIYGQDDRREVDDPRNDPKMRNASRAVAVIVPRSSVLGPRTGDGPDWRYLAHTTLNERENLCPSEAFRDQPTPGYCTAFLVGPDLVATAGHCVRSSSDCSNIALVFEFVGGPNHPNRERVPASNVFTCRRLEVQSVDTASGADFALIRLDRLAYGRTALGLRMIGSLGLGTEVTVIGHPSGLPAKITAGGTVRRADSTGFFVINSDTFSGNSGSPVLNDETALVEGIVVRGDDDYEDGPNHCRVAKHCDPGGCRGEDATRVEFFRRLVPPLVP